MLEEYISGSSSCIRKLVFVTVYICTLGLISLSLLLYYELYYKLKADIELIKDSIIVIYCITVRPGAQHHSAIGTKKV